MRQFRLYFVLLLSAVSVQTFSQGVGIPSKKAGIGFGNLPAFTGVRFNFKDRDLVKVNGINVTAWMPKDEDAMSGTVSGLALGVPLAAGSGSIHGIGIGIFGVGARRNLYGINAGGLGVGAGGNVKGINVGGLGVGAGGTLWGINVGGLGVGSGGKLIGLNVGGLGVGAGGSVSGINVGGLGVGAGGTLSGINVGGLGIGAGGSLSGINIAALGAGAGGKVSGITVAGIGIGAGESVNGLTLAGIGVGSPTVRGIVISPAAGGNNVSGLMIVPAYFRLGDRNNTDDGHEGPAATIKGVSISAFNHIMGSFNGVSIGIFNYAYHQRGLQLGLLNYVKDNPRGLRMLPLFNTSFK
jgi:hypothetical protein